MDEHVVDKRAFGVHQTGVLGSPDRQLRVVVTRHALDEVEGTRTADEDLPHMGHVEQAGAAAHRIVFLGE